MQAAGCKTLFDMDELSVMGLVEALGRLPRLLKIRKQLGSILSTTHQMYLLVLMPLTLTCRKAAKEAGIKTAQYVSPSVWAWRENVFIKSVPLI